MKFIKMKILAVVFATMISPHAVAAKTIIMDCDGTYFKYSKSFWKNAEVAVRKDADWEPWCAESIKITDGGATCEYVVEKEIGETVYEYAYVDKNYIDFARKELSQRHSFCKNNNNNKLCEVRAFMGWGAALDAKNSDGNDKLYEKKDKKLKPSWSYGCSSFLGESEGPNFEKNGFYDLPLSVYQKIHLPKMGAQRCSISSNFVVSEIKKTNRIAFLDFLLLSRDGSSEVKCQLID